MPVHIGIVGCSVEGAALCYPTLRVEGASHMRHAHAHPEVSMHTHSLAAYFDCLDRGDLDGVGRLMLFSASKVAAAGADFLICPGNTIYQAMHLVLPKSRRPWLHISEVVADEAVSRSFRSVGVLGTHWLVDREVYPHTLSAAGPEAVRPGADEREQMGRIVTDGLVRGVIRPESTEVLRRLTDRLNAQGCDAVVLGCTEMPLVLNDGKSSLPTRGSTRLSARAALRRANVFEQANT